ncbi:2526_t:CDS:2 [Dentiscutata erythropus]|uniref:2526_t:CDS:1 n=1 Tax=Dentiscutata erythropus TaxID=1348616 RepID=A0A9N9GJA2_9GLOM|nr:2526_t:CDS:2 [Dentiscutata erythropus]
MYGTSGLFIEEVVFAMTSNDSNESNCFHPLPDKSKQKGVNTL